MGAAGNGNNVTGILQFEARRAGERLLLKQKVGGSNPLLPRHMRSSRALPRVNDRRINNTWG